MINLLVQMQRLNCLTWSVHFRFLYSFSAAPVAVLYPSRSFAVGNDFLIHWEVRPAQSLICSRLDKVICTFERMLRSSGKYGQRHLSRINYSSSSRSEFRSFFFCFQAMGKFIPRSPAHFRIVSGQTGKVYEYREIACGDWRWYRWNYSVCLLAPYYQFTIFSIL
jgi:hypothetical protein